MEYIHNYTQNIKTGLSESECCHDTVLLRTGPGFVFGTSTVHESIEATLRRRRILFARFVACVEDTRLPKYVMFGELEGARGLCEGAGKRVDGVLTGRP